MNTSKPVSEVVSHLNELASDSSSTEEAIVAAFRNDLPRLLDFVQKSVDVAEKAHELLANAYSTQDAEGIRILSEDAVKLQWALRAIGFGADDATDDSGDETSFSV